MGIPDGMTCEVCGVALTSESPEVWAVVDILDVTPPGERHTHYKGIMPAHWYCGAHNRPARLYRDTPDGRMYIEDRAKVES